MVSTVERTHDAHFNLTSDAVVEAMISLCAQGLWMDVAKVEERTGEQASTRVCSYRSVRAAKSTISEEMGLISLFPTWPHEPTGAIGSSNNNCRVPAQALGVGHLEAKRG